jgi:hypothetical protein
MNNKIYLPSGYLNIRGILAYKCTFNFIVGGRATGKTYGALSTVLEDDIKFMLMRRTQAQADLINKPDFSPFKPVCDDRHIEITTASVSKYNAKFMLNDETIGYTCALSTIANMRGFDASDVKLLIYDEFIPERHERPIKQEGAAFLNAYETMNRNRELKGKRPLTVLCLANAFDIANPIFLEQGLVGIAEKMKQNGRELYIDRDKSILILMPDSNKIMTKKSATALYKLTEGSEFSKMALKNDFIYNPTDNIRSMPLREFKPLVTVGEITIYKHKSKRLYYVSEHRTGDPPEYTTDEINLKRYQKAFGMRFYRLYMQNCFKFENMLTKSIFEMYTI